MRKGSEKLGKFLNAKQQGRLDGFFSVKPKTSPTKKDKDKDKDHDKGKVKAKGTKRKVTTMTYYQLFEAETFFDGRAMKKTRRKQGAARRRRRRSDNGSGKSHLCLDAFHF